MRAEHFLKRLYFYGISHPCRGAVRFYKIHVRRGVIHLVEGVFYGYFLALGVGGGYALALAVRRRAHGIYQGVNPVAVAHRVGQAFKYVNRDRLRHHEAVGPFVKGVGAISGQGAYFAEFDESRRRHHLIRSPRHRHVELTRPQAQRCVVQRCH